MAVRNNRLLRGFCIKVSVNTAPDRGLDVSTPGTWFKLRPDPRNKDHDNDPVIMILMNGNSQLAA